MQFSVRAAIRYGWEAFKQRPWFFAGVALVVSLLLPILIYLVSVLLAASVMGVAVMLPDEDFRSFGLLSAAVFLGLYFSFIILVGMGVTAFFPCRSR